MDLVHVDILRIDVAAFTDLCYHFKDLMLPLYGLVLSLYGLVLPFLRLSVDTFTTDYSKRGGGGWTVCGVFQYSCTS